jgi:hypothetical protein
MTREFNKQRRDDVRPSSRNSSSGRYGEERSPRPARPRLNRKTVDRAWESGAGPNHADYRPRTNNNGQASRQGWRRDQQAGSSPAQYSRNNRRPFGRDDNRQPDRTPRGNSDNRPRSYNEGARNFDHRRSFIDRPRRNNSYDAPRNFDEQRPQYGNRNQGQGYRPHGFDRDDRDGRKGHTPRNFERNNAGPRGYQQRKPQNPRWQSRPAVQRDYAPRRYDAPRYPVQREQFEGDYERFNSYDAPPRHAGHFQDQSGRQPYRDEEPEERHVTRLPDGRVLKGPRPAQRRNAQFWTGISDETEALVAPIETSVVAETANGHPEELESPQPAKAAPTKKAQPKAQAKPRTASAAVRGKKVSAKKSVEKAEKPRSTGPKPSQRGFKWPTS